MKRIILFSILFSFLLIINSYATAPALQVSTNVTPSSIAPGEDGFVQITITNVGTVTADKVVVTLDSIDNPLVSKTIFSAEGIGGLEAAKSTYTVFRFSVPPETPEGYYNIQFKIKSCENSACRDFSSFAIVDVKDVFTNFEVSFQSTNEMTSLSVANIGINPAIAVSISIPEQDTFYTIGTSTVFLGNLNSGDYTIADFKIASEGNVTKGNLLTEISYTDTNGNRHTVQKETPIELPTGIVIETQSTNIWLYIIFIIIVAFVIIIFFKIKRKKK